LIYVVTNGATPRIDSYDFRVAFAQIAKDRASSSAVLTRDY